MVGACLEGLGYGRRGKALPGDEGCSLAVPLSPACCQPKERFPHAEDCNREQGHGRPARHRAKVAQSLARGRLYRDRQHRPVAHHPGDTMEGACGSWKSPTSRFGPFQFQAREIPNGWESSRSRDSPSYRGRLRPGRCGQRKEDNKKNK